MGARARAGAGGGAGRARRRRAPRRRERRPALDVAGPSRRSATAACPARAISSRGCAPPSSARASLVSASAIGYYGAHGEEPLDEDAPPGSDFLAQVCADWEAEARGASQLGMRVVAGAHRRRARPRRRSAREDAARLPARRGRPGRRRAPVHLLDPPRGPRRDDARGARWTSAGAARSTPPRPSRSRNRDFSRTLGRVLRRPALLPVPGIALRAALRRDGRDRHRRARASCPPSRSCSATSSAIPSSRRRCARRSRALAASRPVACRHRRRARGGRAGRSGSR